MFLINFSVLGFGPEASLACMCRHTHTCFNCRSTVTSRPGFLFLSFLLQLLQAPGHLRMRGDWDAEQKQPSHSVHYTCQGLEHPKARLAACPVTVSLSPCVRTVPRIKSTKLFTSASPKGPWTA